MRLGGKSSDHRGWQLELHPAVECHNNSISQLLVLFLRPKVKLTKYLFAYNIKEFEK